MEDKAVIELTTEEYHKLVKDSNELKVVRNAIAILVSQVIVPEEVDE